MVYFKDIFEALDQYYRPCLRCRPDIHLDYYNGNASGTLIVQTALKMIYDGYLNTNTITDLANELAVSDRHLRKLFIENLGVPPVKIARYHRALFAKKIAPVFRQARYRHRFCLGIRLHPSVQPGFQRNFWYYAVGDKKGKGQFRRRKHYLAAALCQTVRFFPSD
ncbi:putative methylphosphotriester-DNA alkyltransferase [Desulforapulum autotrophicum HRM2]|uniref:Methylphosphotriester-DNA alkyltransferase n=1 Tax=Desulforapulum autotrophicum (strain ATCC 43914 / DSM 3382 / VKM B-1955 / HRM2) TaxID=177437 RepID=C0Q969_DESAH|nr:putative methylphosphotriester-DNA alkyltransferase [Desulforapulum autotrophicum HRM2]